MKKLILLFAITCNGLLLAQKIGLPSVPPPKPVEEKPVLLKEDEKIYETVDEKPVFNSQNYKSFEENFVQNFDTSVLDEESKEKIDFCEISIVCEIDGSISSPVKISTTNHELSAEIFRTVKSFKKRSVFKPATVKGKAVRYTMKYRIEYDYKTEELKVKLIN